MTLEEHNTEFRALTAHLDTHPSNPSLLYSACVDLADALLDAGGDNAASFNCGEAERIAEFLEAMGRADDAAAFRRWHAVDDDEGDRHDPETGALREEQDQ